MKRIITSIAALGFILTASTAMADNIAVQNGKVAVNLSGTQMTRFTVKGEKITAVRTLQATDGPQIIVQNDQSTGDVYVGFDGDAVGKVFSVYFTTDTGDTILALMSPDEGLARNIEIVPEFKKSGTPSPNVGLKPTPGYSEAVVSFLKHLYSGESVDGLSCEDAPSKGQQTPNFMVYQVRTCTADGVSGFVLQMMNTTKAPAAVTPDRFFLPHVLAVGVSKETLDPGESARVYVEEETSQ